MHSPLAGGSTPRISLGTYGPLFLRRGLTLTPSQIATHVHVIGVSGSGKSRFLAHLYLSLLRAGLSATLIDPHGDLARLVLAHLIAAGDNREDLFKRIVYLDLPAAARAGKYLPFNVLSQQTSPHSIASNVMEAMHRAWPALGGGNAATFDTLVQNGVKVLLSNKLPLVRLYNLLTDKEYRDQLLAQEQDGDVVSVFRNWFDRLPPRDQADQAGATLRRVNLLSFDPVLKYSLGQADTLLNFREIIEANRSVIINLAIDNAEARRLLGSLLTVSAEQGALSRADITAEKRKHVHFLIIDEFSEFTAQSEEALARMLSLTRKYGLYLVMAHQTWSQASERLRGALQNVGLEVAFRLGRSDAERSATLLGHVDPLTVKHEVTNEHALERTHPVFYSLPEQWESWVEELQDLPQRRAYIGLYNVKRKWWQLMGYKPRKVVRVKTPALPDPHVAKAELEQVEAEYLDRYFRSQGQIEGELQATVAQAQAPTISRVEPDTSSSAQPVQEPPKPRVPTRGVIFACSKRTLAGKGKRKKSERARI